VLNITLKDSNNGVLHSVLLFLWNLPIVQYSKKTRPLRFGRWLCSRLQVKIPTLLVPIEGANPNPRNLVDLFLDY
jgi:hypothetical protein